MFLGLLTYVVTVYQILVKALREPECLLYIRDGTLPTMIPLQRVLNILACGI